MIQTENTAIVLRRTDFGEDDRMVTLFSPTRGRVDAAIRHCRKPKSHNLNAGELFALGDYMLLEKDGRMTVTSVHLIETFYPLRSDFDRLACGTWLLNLVEAVAEPEQERQELFMLLLHTLSRLTFSDQSWQPLLAGFLLHFSACEGFKPRLNHCALCGRPLKTPEKEDSPDPSGRLFFDAEAGGTICGICGKAARFARLSPEEHRWMQMALQSGSASWVNTPEAFAPFGMLRHYVEYRLGRRFKSGTMLPRTE